MSAFPYMQNFPVTRLPAPLREYLRLHSVPGPTVWLSPVERPIPFTSSADGTRNIAVFNLDLGVATSGVFRNRLSPFGPYDVRALYEQEKKELFFPQPNEALVEVIAEQRQVRAHIFVTDETRLTYFDLSNISDELTVEEKYALAVMGYIAKYRREVVERLKAQGLDIDAGFERLVQKGYVKRTKAGLSITPEGQLRKSEAGVKKLVI